MPVELKGYPVFLNSLRIPLMHCLCPINAESPQILMKGLGATYIGENPLMTYQINR